MEEKQLARCWLDIATTDLKASKVLYENKFYPQSLYFMHQSVEKLGKAHAIARKYIKSGKVFSHDLKANVYKGTEVDFLQKIKEGVPRLEKASFKDKTIWKEANTFLNSEQGSEVKHLLHRLIVLKDFNPSKHYKNYFNVELARLTKQHTELDIQLNEIKTNFAKAPDKLTDLTEKQKDDLIQLFKMIKERKMNKIDFAIGVLFFLSYILPKQETFRYPEFNPLKIYNEKNVLVKNYIQLYQYLNTAIQTFTSIYQENQFFALYDP